MIGYFIWSIVNISCALLQFNVVCHSSFYFWAAIGISILIFSLNQFDLKMMGTHTANGVPLVLLHVLMAYGQIFLFCFYGEHLLNTFERLNESIFECDWYRFPLESQKLLNAMLVAAQRPVYIRGFGSSACTHESFKEVRTICKSYYFKVASFE